MKEIDVYYDVKLSLYQLHIMQHALGISDKLEYTSQPIWKKIKSYRNRYVVKKDSKLDKAFDYLLHTCKFMQWENPTTLVVNDLGVNYLETLFRTKIVQYEEDVYKQK